MANSVMIQYLEDTKGVIPAHRMRQLLAGCLFQSGSCQEGFTPFHLTPFDLLVLHPDGYLACIKSLSPSWVAAMPQYDLESLKSEKHGREIADDDKFWKNHFKERFAKDRDKIESTLKAASRWLREQTAK
jgi:hypothetical protein